MHSPTHELEHKIVSGHRADLAQTLNDMANEYWLPAGFTSDVINGQIVLTAWLVRPVLSEQPNEAALQSEVA